MSYSIKIVKSGVFKEEIKNRFRSIVNIDGDDELCYIQSSSRISNYIELENKKVYLVNNHLCNKMKYTLFSIPFKRNMIFLVPSLANDVILSEIKDRRLSYLGHRNKVLKEVIVEDYKCDLFIPQSKTLIEIKAFISKKDSIFPIVYSERTIIQLGKMEKLISKGYKCVFMIVSLNPYISSIYINKTTKLYNKLIDLKDKGLLVKGLSIYYCDSGIKIKKNVEIVF